MKKQILKSRLFDICAGAGLIWNKDGYWEYFCMESYANAVQAIEKVFNLEGDSRLRKPWNWKELESLDTLTVLVSDAIKFDKKKDEKKS